MPNHLTPEQESAYHRDGFVTVKGLFDPQEVEYLNRAMAEDPAIRDHMLIRPDQEGFGTKIALWNRAGNSVYGLAARVPRMTGAAERLVGEPVYHYQSKLTAKEPFEGGAWEWHQDYGYWYYNGCLRPAMVSCMIALDRTTPENGCLKVVRGSHHLGRVDHVPLTEKQNEADPARMKEILKRHEVVDVVMDPGDAFFFHCNTLHRSDRNTSDQRRWTLIICYNAITNDAFVTEDDRSFVPLEPAADDSILAAGARFSDGEQEHFASKPYVPDVRKAG